MLLILSGVAGSGKDTIKKRINKKNGKCWVFTFFYI